MRDDPHKEYKNAKEEMRPFAIMLFFGNKTAVKSAKCLESLRSDWRGGVVAASARVVAIMSPAQKIVARFLCLYFEGKVSYKSFWCSHAVNKPGWGGPAIVITHDAWSGNWFGAAVKFDI